MWSRLLLFKNRVVTKRLFSLELEVLWENWQVLYLAAAAALVWWVISYLMVWRMFCLHFSPTHAQTHSRGSRPRVYELALEEKTWHYSIEIRQWVWEGGPPGPILGNAKISAFVTNAKSFEYEIVVLDGVLGLHLASAARGPKRIAGQALRTVVLHLCRSETKAQGESRALERSRFNYSKNPSRVRDGTKE